FFFQAEDGIRDATVTGVQTCALPISWEFARILPGASRTLQAAPVRDRDHGSTRFLRAPEPTPRPAWWRVDRQSAEYFPGRNDGRAPRLRSPSRASPWCRH